MQLIQLITKLLQERETERERERERERDYLCESVRLSIMFGSNVSSCSET